MAIQIEFSRGAAPRRRRIPTGGWEEVTEGGAFPIQFPTGFVELRWKAADLFPQLDDNPGHRDAYVKCLDGKIIRLVWPSIVEFFRQQI